MSTEATKRQPIERVGALPIDYYRAYIKSDLLSDEELSDWKDNEGKSLTEKQIISIKANAKPDAAFIKRIYLDIDGLKSQGGLNDAQIEELVFALEFKGLLPPTFTAGLEPGEKVPISQISSGTLGVIDSAPKDEKTTEPKRTKKPQE